MSVSLFVERAAWQDEWPFWLPGELMPDEIEDLCEQICGMRDPLCVPVRKRLEVAMALQMAKTLVARETPL